MNISEIIKRYPQEQQYLVEILLDIDAASANHCVCEEDIKLVADSLGVTTSHVCSVMSFYTLLSTKERGQYIIQVCKDVPCYLNDDFNVMNTVLDELEVTLGETTRDRRFTVEQTACIGCCDQAPAMRINNQVYTNLTKSKVIEILASYQGGFA